MQRSTNVFTDKITKVQSTTVNDAASRIYHDQFENTLQMTETSSWNKVDSSSCYKLTLYCCNILREEIGNDANKEAGLKDETLVIRGLVDENAIVEAIKREKGHLNKVFTQIRVNSIEKGSVVFFVSLDNMAFLSLQMLSKQVQSFVNWILDIPDVNMMIKNDLDILLIPIDFISTREKEDTMQCENCDTSLLPDSKFCHKCGENIDKKSICSKCNNAVTKENNYCPTCGEKLRRDLHALKTTVNITEENQGERVFKAQSAIKGPESLEEVKQLMKKINEEGSEKFMEHLNKTLDKWKNEKVKFGLAGGSTMGKSSFVNVLTGHTEDNENRAKTSAGGNTTVSSTEYSDARQKIISFTDCPGYGTPDFTYKAYFRQNSIDTFDYVLIFFYVVTTDDIYFAKALDERKMKFCFVRTRLDIDIDSARYDNPQDTDPHLIAETLRQTAVDAIEKQGLLNPIVFVISNRRKDLGHFPNLLSHIEQVLHKEKYHALIYEISTYTRDAIKRKHKLLCDRINSVTMRAVVEEGEDATDFDSGNVEDEKKRIKLQKTV
ncbi:uncharacterized protein LOC143052425 [Mytilus galloprovincialis]|uniref:uncharacterized protein LOC143052425 n=1 Tax=Mytilus galloprovincialis TaxID=29158 RepID=UPI003F7C9864